MAALPAKSSPPEAMPRGIAGLALTAGALADLLDRETALIRAMRVPEIAPLQAEKARLTKLCGTVLKSIDAAAPVAPGLVAQWRAASKRLGDAAAANEMALRVGHAATDRLVAAIVGHIETRQKSIAGYGRPTAPRRPILAGVAVDRRL